MFYTFKTTPEMMHGQVSTKIVFGAYEISLAMNDSLGTQRHLSRTSICVFKKNADGSESNVTEELFGKMRLKQGYVGHPGEIYHPSAETLQQVINKVSRAARREMAS